MQVDSFIIQSHVLRENTLVMIERDSGTPRFVPLLFTSRFQTGGTNSTERADEESLQDLVRWSGTLY